MVGDFASGYIVGLLASIPLGPIGVLCVQRTITKKFLGGYVSALGAATADTVYAAIALFAVSLIMPYVDTYQFQITLVGGAIILGLGLKIFFSKVNPKSIKHNRQSKLSLAKDFFSVFFLVISNPAYISIFLVLFTSFKIDGDAMSGYQHIATISGVLLGAATWWFALTFSISLLRKRFRARHLIIINRVAGVAISLLGVAAVFKAFFFPNSL